MSKTMTPLALLASQSVAAGTTVRSSVIDVSAMDGGELRGKITNSGSAPTAQSVARVLVARSQRAERRRGARSLRRSASLSPSAGAGRGRATSQVF